MIGTTISHYNILEKLGEGGMGVVYKALDTKLKRTVALKFLPPDLTQDFEAKEWFIQEAQAASVIDHANICTIHEINETDDGQMFIVMAYYEGETLKEKLKLGVLAVDRAVDILIQVANGLAFAHEAGITHRDIKPANIMITKRGEVKILDFGLAKLAGQTRLTQTGAVVGTVGYMSPEQTKGEEVDHRTDVWLLGVMFYEMLTGELPFKGDKLMTIIYSILNESPKPVNEILKDVPTGLEHILGKCLSKNLDQRYETATALSNDLRLMLDKPSVPIPSAKRGFIGKLKNQPLKLAPVIAGFVLFSVIVSMIMFQFFKSKQKPTDVSLQGLPSIAVMYFEDNTGNEDAKWLCVWRLPDRAGPAF